MNFELVTKTFLLIFTNLSNKFLVRLHGEYNILVKLCGNTKLNIWEGAYLS